MSEEKTILSCPKCKSQNIKRTRGVYWCADCGCEWRLTEEEPPKTQSLTIRNSTAEFLIFQAQSQANGVEVMYADETIWCTQDAIAALFDKSRTTITEHLQNIFYEGELQKESVCRKFRRTAADGKSYNTQFYNLDAIISVGYRANSTRATQFRQWATAILRQFAIRGYVLDKSLQKKQRSLQNRNLKSIASYKTIYSGQILMMR